MRDLSVNLCCPACGHPLSIRRSMPRVNLSEDKTGVWVVQEVVEPTYLVCTYVARGTFEEIVDFARQRPYAEIEMTGESIKTSAIPLGGLMGGEYRVI